MTDTAVATATPAPAAAPAPAPAPASQESSRVQSIRAAVEAKARARDEQGKFASASPSEPAAAASEEPVVTKKERKYPSSWKKDYEERYKKLAETPDNEWLLDEIERRESDYVKGIEPYKQSAEYAQSLRKAIEPFQPIYQQAGMQPETVMTTLLRYDAMMRQAQPEQRKQLAANFLRTYGVPMEQAAEVPSQQPSVPPQLMQTIQQQQAAIQRLFAERQQELAQSATKEIEDFKKDKPYFEELRPEMADLVSKGLANDLAQAYDKAAWANPVIRAKLIADQQAASNAQRQSQQHVQVAKSAAVQVKGSASPGNSAIRSSAGKDRRALISDLVNRRV